jgi:hypothetical protein
MSSLPFYGFHGLGALGNLGEELRTRLLAATDEFRDAGKIGAFRSFTEANNSLAAASRLASSDRSSAWSQLELAEGYFRSAGSECGSMCNAAKAASYVSLFRQRHAEVEADLERRLAAAGAASEASDAPPVIYGDDVEWTDEDEAAYQAAVARSASQNYGPPASASLPAMTPAQQAMVQQSLDKAASGMVTGPSAHEQAQRARAQFSRSAYSHDRVGTRPMTERQQLDTTLSIRPKPNTALIVGGALLGGAAIFFLGTALFGRRRQ